MVQNPRIFFNFYLIDTEHEFLQCNQSEKAGFKTNYIQPTLYQCIDKFNSDIVKNRKLHTVVCV